MALLGARRPLRKVVAGGEAAGHAPRGGILLGKWRVAAGGTTTRLDLLVKVQPILSYLSGSDHDGMVEILED